jgi:Na+/proline symporter
VAQSFLTRHIGKEASLQNDLASAGIRLQLGQLSQVGPQQPFAHIYLEVSIHHVWISHHRLISSEGLAWFAIPFGFATTLGLTAVALTDSPSFPTYPNPLSQSQVTSGLAASTAATALLGKEGAVALLIVLFMAVTSCASAELIAVSSILTFDIYKTYIKKTAQPSQLIFVSHVMICVFGLTMAVFACIWNGIGIDLGWLVGMSLSNTTASLLTWPSSFWSWAC